MGNQAEQIEDDCRIENPQHEAQAYESLPEVVVGPSGVNPLPSKDEDFDGDPNLYAPQYEYPDGEDEAKDIDHVDGKEQPNLVVPQSNIAGEEGEPKAHDEGNDGVPKEMKQSQHQTPIGLGEAKKPKKKRKAKSKRGAVSSLIRYLFCESGLTNGKGSSKRI